MRLNQLFPNAEVVLALEPEELGIQLLPLLEQMSGPNGLVLGDFLERALGAGHLPGRAPNPTALYPETRRRELSEALREAWAWLEGAALLAPVNTSVGWRKALSRRARRIAKEPDPLRAYSAKRLPKDTLHLSIREDVWAQYHQGNYDIAVFMAMRAVEIAVRNVGECEGSDVGVKLMRKAFGSTGRLRDPQATAGENTALMELFAGAIGYCKNPQSHRDVALSEPDEAAEILALASYLLRIIDTRRLP